MRSIHLHFSSGFGIFVENEKRSGHNQFLGVALPGRLPEYDLGPAVLVMLLSGVILVLLSLWKGAFTLSRKGIWFAMPGTVLVVMSVFFLAGFNGTAYYPSSTDLQSSLTLANSSSSYFTLKVMSWVSLLIPFVFAYIALAWRAMDRKAITREEITGESSKY